MPIKASTRPAVMPKNQCNWNSVFFTTSITLSCCRNLCGVHYALIRKSPAHWNERGLGVLLQKWTLVVSNAVRPAAWLAKWVENALS